MQPKNHHKTTIKPQKKLQGKSSKTRKNNSNKADKETKKEKYFNSKKNTN